MHVADRQQFFAARGEPLVASVGLALWTVPGPAGVERDGLVAALAATVQVATECCRAAKLGGHLDRVLPCGKTRWHAVRGDGATSTRTGSFRRIDCRSEERRVGKECRSRGAPHH